jgi:hypothetical protein
MMCFPDTLALKLARKAEYRSVGRELDSICRSTVNPLEGGPLLGLHRAKSKTGGQLHDRIGQAFPCARELTPSNAVDIPVRVHEPLQQRQPLGLAGYQIICWHVLVTEQTKVA